MINQSEAQAPELIVVEKLRTDLYGNYGLKEETRAIVTPEKSIPGKKINIKSIATSPPRKYPIPNQDKTTSHIPPFPPGFKSLRNEANDDNPETTYTSRTDKYDTSHTNRYDSIKM